MMSAFSTMCTTVNGINGHNWYMCNCCPYGYHIDLDFVRYCQTIGQEADRNESKSKRRRNRRRQRQSMEVLLGIENPFSPSELSSSSSSMIRPCDYNNKYEESVGILDSFNDVVSDFERTLEISKYHSRTLQNPSDTSLQKTSSISSISLHSTSSSTLCPNGDFDTISFDSLSNARSSYSLKNVRQQMALSLQKTRILEDQVKIIPQLQQQLIQLNNENRRLINKLKFEESSVPLILQNGYQQQQTQNNSNNRKNNLKINTTSIGVGNSAAQIRNASTNTQLFFNHNNFMASNYQVCSRCEKDKSSINYDDKITSTTTTITDKSSMISSDEIKKLALSTVDNCTQTELSKQKNAFSVGVMVHPECKDFAIQKSIDCRDIGVSDCTLLDAICSNCQLNSKLNNVDSKKQDFSLYSRSKSFHLGSTTNNSNNESGPLKANEYRTVGCQYDASVLTAKISRGSQCEKRILLTKSSQYSMKRSHKHTQCENRIRKIDIGISTDLVSPPILMDKGCNTPNTTDIKGCEKCRQHQCKDNNISIGKKLDSLTPSRIPRPQISNSPVEFRKIRRQDTYTKVYASNLDTTEQEQSNENIPIRLSGLGISSTTSNPNLEHSASKEVVATSSYENAITTSNSRCNKESTNNNGIKDSPMSSSESTTNTRQSKRMTPCMEMLGAMKVLNDALQKKQHKKHMNSTSAINVIQQEWFKISSLETTNAHHVEDYLDAFEDISTQLLEFIVNLTDDSGNTAMHYAVSHGSFDVVSILLDSKVCDINKTNKAGYTCVMLVSLATIRSQTHANVVKRLFQLADVNIKAQKHGQTALMLAVSHGRFDMVKMLVNAGADINIQDEDGSTALMCAAEHGHVNIVKYFLCQSDCNSTITDIDGCTALKIAMDAGHRHIGVLLYAHERNAHVEHAFSTQDASRRSTGKTLSNHKIHPHSCT